MENIFLAIILLTTFTLGYFAIGRLGKYIEESFCGSPDHQEPGREVYIAEIAGKSTKMISEEVSSVLDSLPDQNEYAIIICRSNDPHIIEYLEESGCAKEHDHQQ